VRTDPFVLDDARADELAGTGVVVVDGFLGEDAALAARRDLEALWRAGCFRPARVGTGERRRLLRQVRRDEICWLSEEAPFEASCGATGVRPPPAVTRFFARMGLLREALNASCFLGLRRFECHAARYERGAFYRAHVDTFVGDPSRVISFAYFLNPGWRAEDGGCLRIHGGAARDIEPALDRLVLFRAGDVLHEVLRVTGRERFTLTGWLRRDA
jgi:SM-20-related protein